MITTRNTSRRDLLVGSLALPFVLAGAGRAGPAFAQAPDKSPPQTPAETPFDANVVRKTARALAEKPYEAPDTKLPAGLTDLDYDKYRTIRFKPDRALWRGEGLPFEVQFFHRGFLFAERVALHEVSQGKARPIVYAADLFDFGAVPPLPPDARVGFAGFRLHTPINRPDTYDEVAVFLGASYFRAVAKGQTYGLSARGLSIGTGDPKGEEFPAFRAFWIEKPAKQTGSIVVHALLDSKSAAAAYRFTIRPGETTVFDVEMTLYPRTDVPLPGIGTCTSMFFFGPNDRAGVDDFRPAVHDSDGLAIRNGRGEEIWRPLVNPTDLQISTFEDTNPRGFGLLQRSRDFRSYQDLEARYETRPSLWVEPIGDWGAGAIQLVEIPTKEEIHDNIVAFWRPKDPLAGKGEYWFTYRLHWGAGKAGAPPLAAIAATRAGAGPDDTRRFVLDITGDKLAGIDPASVRGAVETDKGKILNVVTQPNPVTGGWRFSFELAPERETVVELRARLMRGDEALSETWLYRWTP
ncbi:glucan biosynthesis protein [Rhodoplanes sp.]|uniref:glucan biosynthesis protein n=1 Tax=Rhodoplanes sp. TaxID=1968906 RepID=UPI0025CECF51|nr:glucan biosynthesis protein G [Rhodoplanes sp.]